MRYRSVNSTPFVQRSSASALAVLSLAVAASCSADGPQETDPIPTTVIAPTVSTGILDYDIGLYRARFNTTVKHERDFLDFTWTLYGVYDEELDRVNDIMVILGYEFCALFEGGSTFDEAVSDIETTEPFKPLYGDSPAELELMRTSVRPLLGAVGFATLDSLCLEESDRILGEFDLTD